MPPQKSEEIQDFLRTVPPFHDLTDADLKGLSAAVSEMSYGKGSYLLHQDGPVSEHLIIIRRGGVKVFVRTGDEEEVLIDYRSEGDVVGFLSLMSGDKSRASVVAVEETLCYLINRSDALKLFESHPGLSEFFLSSYLSKYIDKTYKEMHDKTLLYGGGEKLLFTTPVGEIVVRPTVTASVTSSIREVAVIMSRNRISSVVILDRSRAPVGIVTDRDLRDKVVSKGRNVNDQVGSIMNSPLIKTEARDYCFEAVLKMIRYNIHHLLVVDQGRLAGVITNHDLMMLQGTSPISLVRDIESQHSIEGLLPAARKINGIVGLLLKEGARADNIERIITEINDRLVRKVLDICEKRLGVPPLGYCWIVMGSEGRKEQTFKTDQDNAIIYEDPETPVEEGAARSYMEELSFLVKDALVQCGFPVCPGNYMASNPVWRQPLSVWKEYFTKWIKTPTPEAILSSAILFDFRPLYGDHAPAEKLRRYLSGLASDEDMFLKHMADMTVRLRPPLGFFKTFVVEKSGEHKDELNLKFKCIAPLIDVVRLFSLEKGVTEVSTVDRLHALKGRHSVVNEMGDDIEHAFEFISLLRIHHQYHQIEAGTEPDNFVNPDELSNLEKRSLRESCQIISRAQDAIAKQYSPGMRI